VGVFDRLRGRRPSGELQPLRMALAVLADVGIDARLLDDRAAWEVRRRAGSPCACVLASELRRDEQGKFGWPLLLRFGPGSPFAHSSEWQPLAERIVARLDDAGFEARWRGGRSDLIELRPRRRTATGQQPA
jgi:hypothetical protein